MTGGLSERALDLTIDKVCNTVTLAYFVAWIGAGAWGNVLKQRSQP